MKTRHLGTPRVCLRFWVAGPTASEIRKDNSQLPGTPGLFGRGVPGFFVGISTRNMAQRQEYKLRRAILVRGGTGSGQRQITDLL